MNTCKAQCLDEMDRCFLRLFLKRVSDRKASSNRW
jgi:hypothetical protein